ncbi:hypothetical protein VN97_g8528 [Penicillium thymicola]|uniref:Uncharacterized protein n=1 Tax=Penicillium thymicola TaxID=293382 RepID=A0AAI9TCL4_PENTH|nr:hypothetical protein VN97_g8528 [Penicillium thymicola]
MNAGRHHTALPFCSSSQLNSSLFPHFRNFGIQDSTESQIKHIHPITAFNSDHRHNNRYLAVRTSSSFSIPISSKVRNQ